MSEEYIGDVNVKVPLAKIDGIYALGTAKVEEVLLNNNNIDSATNKPTSVTLDKLSEELSSARYKKMDLTNRTGYTKISGMTPPAQPAAAATANAPVQAPTEQPVTPEQPVTQALPKFHDGTKYSDKEAVDVVKGEYIYGGTVIGSINNNNNEYTIRIGPDGIGYTFNVNKQYIRKLTPLTKNQGNVEYYDAPVSNARDVINIDNTTVWKHAEIVNVSINNNNPTVPMYIIQPEQGQEQYTISPNATGIGRYRLRVKINTNEFDFTGGKKRRTHRKKSRQNRRRRSIRYTRN